MALNFDKMWQDPVTAMDHASIGEYLGGDLIGQANYCAIRLSHGLMASGHKITQPSDFRDREGNKYIIRVATMQSYLSKVLGTPKEVTSKQAIAGRRGIVLFTIAYSDATGHVTLWNGSDLRHPAGTVDEQFRKSTKTFFWQL
ncbi:uncharacterized protein MONBRDRAFT_37110 [Monosiga brevicollis MX1]|uniref:Uncharacterized protein n=1 Tax=Monosiga brevicollis TaxID=81824 RepID=A9UZN1_MONBE|nr:uncharacterized protein MONBRDRAFT_37110 [Monosiga brevicollis MX1]EDQ89261.1 predicted protein [Monosiga brevicollis MX1]|eukprot:XP_001745837.1 hypothetical protein [Monosiga brevicollis MX1]